MPQGVVHDMINIHTSQFDYVRMHMGIGGQTESIFHIRKKL